MSRPMHHRPAGAGSVQARTRHKLKFWVYGPQVDGSRVLVGRYETRWQGDRALLAWYVVHAVVMLAALGTTCERQSA